MHRTEDLDADRVLRELARLLAPYIADELDRPRPTVSPDYDPATCTLFVSTLGTGVLERALALFGKLDKDGRVSSLELAEAISPQGPRAIGGMLTSPLKRRAKQLGLPLPFLGGEGSRDYGGVPSPRPDDDPRRTYWQDHNGIAARLVAAIQAELPNRPDARASRRGRFIWKEGEYTILTGEQLGEVIPHAPKRVGRPRNDKPQ